MPNSLKFRHDFKKEKTLKFIVMLLNVQLQLITGFEMMLVMLFACSDKDTNCYSALCANTIILCV